MKKKPAIKTTNEHDAYRKRTSTCCAQEIERI